MQTCLHCAHLIGIFAEFDLDRDLIARVIFRLLPIKGPFCLAIDRTNWQFGSTDINIFMLAVVHDGVAYPLLFSILPKKDTSNTKERIELVQRYVRLFGAKSIDCLLADREFVGEHWVKWLNDSGIRYGLDIVTEFLLRGRNEYKIPIFDFSAIANQILTPD